MARLSCSPADEESRFLLTTGKRQDCSAQGIAAESPQPEQSEGEDLERKARFLRSKNAPEFLDVNRQQIVENS
jgi:hypothetical protein